MYYFAVIQCAIALIQADTIPFGAICNASCATESVDEDDMWMWILHFYLPIAVILLRF